MATFTFVATCSDPTSIYAKLLPFPSGPLLIDTLVVKLLPTGRKIEGKNVNHTPLLSLFGPSVFRFEAIPPYDPIVPTLLYLAPEGVPSWEGLLAVHFVHSTFKSLLQTSCFGSDCWNLTYVELPASLEDSDGFPSDLFMAIVGDLTGRLEFSQDWDEEDARANLFPNEVVGSVTVMVKSAEAKTQFERVLRDSSRSMDAEDEEVEEQLRNIKVVVRKMGG